MGLLVSSALIAPASARADAAAAEALFRNGRDLMAKKDYARACPMLADSFRSDPATGTLLALAICHENQGKLASAWRMYTEVANRSKKEARPDREKAARAKAAALEPQISVLTIVIPTEVRELEGVAMKRDGVPVSPTLWGKSIAIDGGTHQIEVTARGKKRWRSSVTIASTQDVKSITVPPLEEEEAAPPAPAASAHATEEPPPSAPAAATPAPPPATSTSSSSSDPKVDVAASLPGADTSRKSSALQGAGAATFIAGVAGLGFGTVFAFRAIGKNKDSKNGCLGNVCTAQGKQDRWDAYDAGNMATYGFIAGGTLVVGGALMYLIGRPSPSVSACNGSTCFEATVGASTDGVGGVLRGSFW